MPWYPHNHDDRYVKQSSQAWNRVLDDVDEIVPREDLDVLYAPKDSTAAGLAARPTLTETNALYPDKTATESALGTHATQIAENSALAAMLAFNVYDPTDSGYGAVRDASDAATKTANTAAINAAAADATTNGGILYIKGDFYCDPGVVLQSHVAGESGRLLFSDTTAVAVTFGNATSGAQLYDRIAVLPQIEQTGKSALGAGVWGTDTGLKLANLHHCHVTIPAVRSFGTNIHQIALGTGNVYNNIYLGIVDNGKTGLHIDPQTGGWVNENIYVGGRFRILSAEGSGIVGASYIKASTNGAHAANNLRFLKPSLEGNGPQYILDLNDVYYAVIDQARYEATTPTARLTDCNGIVFWQGYNQGALTLTGTGSLNIRRFTRDWDRMHAGGGTSGVQRLANTSSSASPTITVMEAGATDATDPATAYAVAIGAQSIRLKRAADTNPRLYLDAVNGVIQWGHPTAAADIGMRWGNADRLTLDPGDMFRVGSVASLPTASSAYRGYTVRVEGGAGVADNTYECVKTSADTYVWRKVVVPEPQAALTAPNVDAIDATYDATEQGVIDNLRTRVNELESRLQTLGLISV